MFEIERTSAFSGPLPPPGVLIGYERALTGAADRIFAMAERQEAHRHEMEKAVLDINREQIRNGVRITYVGQASAVVVSMTAILGSVYLAAVGESAAGVIGVLGSLATLAGVFLIDRFARTRRSNDEGDGPGGDEDAAEDQEPAQ
jgi:uncharacterized membrane protein